MSLATPEKIRTLQRKQYRKAKAAPAFRFYVLYDKICREDILRHAYGLARGNAGAPGVDGVSFAQIEERGAEVWWASVRAASRLLVIEWSRPPPSSCWDPSSRRTSRTMPMAIALLAGRWTQSRKYTGSSAGATPMWLTLTYPATSIPHNELLRS